MKSNSCLIEPSTPSILFAHVANTRHGPFVWAAHSQGVCYGQWIEPTHLGTLNDSPHAELPYWLYEQVRSLLQHSFPQFSCWIREDSSNPFELNCPTDAEHPLSWLDQAHRCAFESSGEPLPPLAPSGTPFQQKVWQALRAIPMGQTQTYAQIAQTIGQPKAQQAVGQACGANPIALLIPCHRVIKTNGGLGGYRWGLDVKQDLLRAEQLTLFKNTIQTPH